MCVSSRAQISSASFRSRSGSLPALAEHFGRSERAGGGEDEGRPRAARDASRPGWTGDGSGYVSRAAAAATTTTVTVTATVTATMTANA